ncbi:MAG: endonuclease/exonuclease/phosphatase family protein [Actinomycetota bacterium]
MEPFTVATYNVHHCEGLDGVVDTGRIAAVVAGLGADIVALQELDRHMKRSGGEDQPRVIAELTGYDVRFLPTLRRGHAEYGIALAARDGLGEVRFEALPRLAAEEPRAAAVARWGEVTVIGVHLSQKPAPRALQGGALLDLARAGEPPVVVMGDLNQSRRHLGSFAGASFDPGPDRNRTFLRGPARRVPALLRLAPGMLGSKIDHILTGPGLEVVRAWTIPTRASDHLPLVADIAPSPA